MKTNVWIMMAIACGSFAFTACDDDDDNRIAPDSVVTKAFDSLYPNAQRVSWEYEDGFVKAEFYTGRYESEAWFDHQGNWFLTETDIPYESLPEAVKSSFESGTYANWRIEDVDMLERPETGTVYVIDVESGERDVDLRYMDNGTLINEGNTGNTGDENRPSTVPSSIREAVLSLYPGATIFEIDTDRNGTEVDIWHDNLHKEVWFSANNEWIMTETDISYQNLPEAVKNSFESGAYSNWRVEDVDMLERPESGTVYIIDVESGERDIDLRYMDNGTLINEGNTGNTSDENRPTITPNSIREAVLSLYPGATIFEIDTDRNGTEVDIWHDNLHKEVRFDTNDQWLYTEWDIRRTEIPSVVLSAFNASEYASYRIDDTNVIQKADGIYYEFELERGERDIILLFDEAGNIAPSTI